VIQGSIVTGLLAFCDWAAAFLRASLLEGLCRFAGNVTGPGRKCLETRLASNASPHACSKY
jgi:hypothetical protein